MITRWRPILETCAVAISYCAVAHALYDQTPATLFTTIPLGLLILIWLDERLTTYCVATGSSPRWKGNRSARSAAVAR